MDPWPSTILRQLGMDRVLDGLSIVIVRLTVRIGQSCNVGEE